MGNFASSKRLRSTLENAYLCKDTPERLGQLLLIDALKDAFIDSAKMVPLLFIVYVGIEFIELKFGNKMAKAVAKAGPFGPVLGALTATIPQCGVSVMGTALYTQRLITIGTLFAVYIGTSDEAIPVIMSQPNKAPLLITLIATKLVLAIIVGYALDAIFRKRNARIYEHINAYAQDQDEASHNHEPAFEEKACCGHQASTPHRTISLRDLLYHPLIHTLKIFAFIFVITVALNLVFAAIGPEVLRDALAQHTLLQPFLAALIGLIPNCAASVAIAQFYITGTITFGATVAGLSAGGGLGVLLLFKEGDKKEGARIVALLCAISVIAGLILTLI